jgi:predicted phosphodiesterase
MGEQTPLPAADMIGGTTTVEARRIGFLGDDHNANEDGSDLPAEVLAAFEGVDLIVHLGHMGVRDLFARGTLDRLATIAPVLAVRDQSTAPDGTKIITPAEGERVKGLTRVIDLKGMRVGAVHNLAIAPGPEIGAPPGGLPELTGVPVRDVIQSKFGGDVEVVAYASTHRAAAILADGILFVNPGSPTYPKGPGYVAGQRQLGTVGILDVSSGAPAFEVVELRHFSTDESASEQQPVAAAAR